MLVRNFVEGWQRLLQAMQQRVLPMLALLQRSRTCLPQWHSAREEGCSGIG